MIERNHLFSIAYRVADLDANGNWCNWRDYSTIAGARKEFISRAGSAVLAGVIELQWESQKTDYDGSHYWEGDFEEEIPNPLQWKRDGIADPPSMTDGEYVERMEQICTTARRQFYEIHYPHLLHLN